MDVGILPAKLLLEPRRCSIVLDASNNSGKNKGPLKLLASRSRMERQLKVPNSVGNVPLMAFWNMCSSHSEVNAPSSVGRLPLSWFESSKHYL